MYDPSYPRCDQFPSFSPNTISYVYPDGVGWPYANEYGKHFSAGQAYLQFKSQEEIHNAGILMLGALWDVYSAIRGGIQRE